ncbi:MAG: penicillin acylase family protein, partial [Candidatus Omnitrophica bacterium]|nr:penicillin acylase family protein [Candidatus Omnitrophota bacterium]
CFRVCHFDEANDGKLVMNGGDGFVFVVEFGETPMAYSVLGFSQSGREGSEHYDDQTPLFANNEMKTVAFTEEEIQDQLIEEYHPQVQ